MSKSPYFNFYRTMIDYFKALECDQEESGPGKPVPMSESFAPYLAGSAFHDALADFARQGCVHYDMALVAALPVLAERCNRYGAAVQLEQERQPLNLSHVVFAPRAKGKSQTRNFLTRLLREEDDRGVREAEAVQQPAKLAADERLANEKRETYKRTHLVSDSPTAAALTAQLEGQSSSLIFSDEGHIFLSALLRGRADGTQLFAALHDGTDYTEARLTRKDRRVQHPRVCTCLMLQPYYAWEILTRESVMGGLLSRFLVYYCNSRPTAASDARQPDRDPQEEWENQLRSFADFLAGLDSTTVRLDDKAERALRRLERYEGGLTCPDDTRDLFEVACTRSRDKALRLSALRALLFRRTVVGERDVKLSFNLILSAAAAARKLRPREAKNSRSAALRRLFNDFPSARHCNQYQLADILGVSQSLINRIINERK